MVGRLLLDEREGYWRDWFDRERSADRERERELKLLGSVEGKGEKGWKLLVVTVQMFLRSPKFSIIPHCFSL